MDKMIVSSISLFSVAMPELFMLGMVCVMLLLDVCLPQRRQFSTYFLVQMTMLGAIILCLPQFGHYGNPIIILGGGYIVDRLAVLSKLFIYIFSFFSFAYAREYLRSRKIARSDYYLLALLSVLGMSIMASGYHFLTIYLGLELSSLSLYAMIAMYRDSGVAIEASMKYFVLGGLASGLLLYGISLLYGVTGSIQMDMIAQVLQTNHTMVPVVALIFVLAGLAFKFGAVPFHMWVPDVYQGAPTPVTLFIASAPKVAAFAITMRVLIEALPNLQVDWVHMLMVISVLSMFLGNVLAIAQTNIKRMLAYSSIAHIGYTLLGIIAGPYSSQGYSAAMFYIVTYVMVAAGGFAIIVIMGRAGVEMDKLTDYRGLNARNPWLALMMLLLLFSMAGVPPTVGFFAKLGLLEALIQAGDIWLAVLALIFAVIGVYYYLRVVMLMYFEEPIEDYLNQPVLVSRDLMIAITVNGSAALVLGLLPSYLIDLCRISVG